MQKVETIKKTSLFRTVYQNTRKMWQKMIAKFLSTSITSFGFARFFSWIFFVLILCSGLVLSIFLGITTRNNLILSQESYSLLLADNMNKQIFSRFTLPVAYASGRVALSNPDQYRLLDEVVDSLMYGLNIEAVRIFNTKSVVAYSTNIDEVRGEELATDKIKDIFVNEKHHFEIISDLSFYEALFVPNLPENSFVMRTNFPLTINFELGPFRVTEGEKPPILGVMQLQQDVTQIYKTAIRQQWFIFIGFFVSTLALFIILQIIAKTAERIISERIKESKDLEEELYQREKLAAMGTMVASIAHEVRNPLGIIKSSAEYLMHRQEEGSTERKLLTAIFDETARLGVTVNEFLDYARPRQQAKNIIDVAFVIQKVWNFMENDFAKSAIEVEFHLPEKLQILGDEDSLYGAISNIFINAKEALNAKTVLINKDVKRNLAEEVFQAKFSIVGFKKRSGEVHVRFVDNGIGLPVSPNKALDPFFTTKETGTGLGLPIVKSIIEAHQGKITLDSNDEGGATVNIVFYSFTE